jgi:PTH1 family peptidyl-tRNA hydrolase
MQSVRVIAGLGNPGRQYDGTRHNLGFAALDRLAQRHGVQWKADTRLFAHTASIIIAGKGILLLKPQTFMNLSGKAIGAVCRFYKWRPSDVLVVYDETQLPLGRVKLNTTGGAGGHNGVDHIIQLLGRDFPRYRIGIGEKPHPQMTLTDYVLGKLGPAEVSELERCMESIVNGLEQVVHEGPLLAANSINQRISTINE